MSLKYAILGFLNYRPFTGYDLKKAFDTSVRHFWPADQSQIYRTLARLTERGLAEVELVLQDDRPNRKVYHITEAGREALRRWMTMSLPYKQARSAMLVQVFFSGQLGDEEILAALERQAERLRATLKRYSQIPQEIPSYAEEVDSPREVFFWMLTLECGIKVNEAWLEWIESVIQRIKNGQHPSH
jgi:PadR family transcriptional regulator, regulatory protein AphA